MPLINISLNQKILFNANTKTTCLYVAYAFLHEMQGGGNYTSLSMYTFPKTYTCLKTRMRSDALYIFGHVYISY